MGPATSGIMDFLAVPPAGLTIALDRASNTSKTKVISIYALAMGIIKMVMADNPSAIYPLSRLPIRSIKVPRIGPKNNPGIEVSATSAPALAAEPVSSRANQGRAIKAIAVEATLVILDSSTNR